MSRYYVVGVRIKIKNNEEILVRASDDIKQPIIVPNQEIIVYRQTSKFAKEQALAQSDLASFEACPVCRVQLKRSVAQKLEWNNDQATINSNDLNLVYAAFNHVDKVNFPQKIYFSLKHKERREQKAAVAKVQQPQEIESLVNQLDQLKQENKREIPKPAQEVFGDTFIPSKPGSPKRSPSRRNFNSPKKKEGINKVKLTVVIIFCALVTTLLSAGTIHAFTIASWVIRVLIIIASALTSLFLSSVLISIFFPQLKRNFEQGDFQTNGNFEFAGWVLFCLFVTISLAAGLTHAFSITSLEARAAITIISFIPGYFITNYLGGNYKSNPISKREEETKDNNAKELPLTPGRAFTPQFANGKTEEKTNPESPRNDVQPKKLTF